MDVKSETTSSCSSRSWTYDVFLSFRGEDTRKNFTDHLYYALIDADIKTFRDDEELRRGEHIATELLQAIRKSRIAIIVFSTNYADSRWCLDELAYIMECSRTLQQKVLPIFCNVDPSVVKEQTDSFGQALAQHEKRFASEIGKVARWRAAINEAANLPTLDFTNFPDGHEAKFIRKIVEQVSRELNRSHLFVANNPVGLDSRLHYMNSLLDVGSKNVRMVGICGMGGIGKTTLAKLVYNKFFQCFEGKSFLRDVREISKLPNGLVLLQEQLLSDTLKTGEMVLSSKDKGINVIKERLCNRRVLVILDDVDHLDQINALVRTRDWFGIGSRIIITTRDQHLLQELEVDAVYMVEELNEIESLELFSWHAFEQAYPPEDYVQLSKNAIAFSGKLPLALTVVGSFFFRKDLNEWIRALKNLKTVRLDGIWKRLRISYDTLSDDGNEKEIFLHIACFFIGMDKDYVVKILDSCGFYAEIGISVLTGRCLVTINEENQLMMHDLHRDMGREIVRDESPRFPGWRSRLWQNEDVIGVLSNHTGTEAVEGLLLNLPSSNGVQFKTEAFTKMNRLRLLHLDSVYLSGGYGQISKDLRWLYWRKFPLESIPIDFHMENLVVIDMQYSNLKQVWKDNKDLGRLKVLNLSHSPYLTKTPDFLKLPNLEKLILENCRRLVELHQSIKHLNRLTLVNVKDCESLKKIPVSICRLKSLEILNLSGCSRVDELPEDIGEIESLREINADGTKIRQMPVAIVGLKNLRKLSLCDCNRNPSSIWRLLIRPWVSTIRSKHPILLPASLAGLSSLTTLRLRNCSLLDDDVPENIGKISSLNVLDLGGNNFCCLPESITSFPNLRFLGVDNCTELQSLPELPKSLIELRANDCTSLKTVAKVSRFEHEPTLYLSNCHNLVEFRGLENLKPSGHVHMEGCYNLADNFRESLLQGCTQSGYGSVFLPGGEIPRWFSHKSGPLLSFEVPCIQDCKCKGFTICVVYEFNTLKNNGLCSSLVTVINKTAGLNMACRPFASSIPRISQDHISVFHLPSNISNQLNGGDQVEVVVDLGDGFIVKKCGFQPVLEQDEQNGTQADSGGMDQSNFASCDTNANQTQAKAKRSHGDDDDNVGHGEGSSNGKPLKRLRCDSY